MTTLDLNHISARTPDHIKDFDFSYITRYKIIASLIAGLKTPENKLKILDVGGYNGPIHNFFPDADITILDVADDDAENYVKASGSKMPFADNTFDIVISCDTLEHIIKAERKSFISEMVRVSSDYIFLGAPLGSRNVVEAELLCDSFYKSMTGESYIWLKEHEEFGLPQKDWLRELLNELHVNFFDFDHTSIDLWSVMLCGSFFLAGNLGAIDETLGSRLRKGNALYLNEVAYTDFPEEGYRTFFAISKKNKIKVQLPEYDNEKKLDVLKKEVMLIGRTVKDFSKLFGAHQDLKNQNQLLHDDNLRINGELMAARQELSNIQNSRTYKLAKSISKAKNGVSRNAKNTQT
jgi:hypothetical protein